MRVKLVTLIIACALALASCAKTTTTTTNQPASNTTAQTSTTATTTPPAATPQAVAANGNTPASAQPGFDASAAAVAPDPCRLLTSDEIKAVQGEEIKETKASQRSDASFAIGQCFYTTATFTKSISLEVTAQNPGSKTSPRAFWQENFTRAAEAGAGEHKHDKDKDKDKDNDKNKRGDEEDEAGAPPQRVAGLGDEAFWINTRVNGALYVLKGDRFIRLSLGGTDSDAARQRKAKTLAQKALARLEQK